jgi:cobalt-zinc-cadmium efflux system protein
MLRSVLREPAHAHSAAGHRHDRAQATAPRRDAATRRRERRRLGWMLVLVAAYMLAELVGGLLAGSLALLADAGHMASDAAALALSLFALWIADRPADARRTFGHLRAEILAALANGVALLAVAALVAIEAVARLRAPTDVRADLLLVVAAGGLAVNAVGLLVLHRGSRHSLNLRGAFLHVASDALGSVAALLAGAAIALFGWRWADPAASLAIAGLVVRAAWQLVREALDVLMEAAPRHLDVDAIRAALVELPDVASVHDLHVWTITSGSVALSCHAVAAAGRDASAVLRSVQQRLADRFGIDHATIQVEATPAAGDEACAEAACDTPSAGA